MRDYTNQALQSLSKTARGIQKIFSSDRVSGIRKFKSPMYYWYTNKKKTAVLSMIITGTISSLIFIATVGGLSVFAILLAIFADAVALILAFGVLLFYPSIAGFFGSEIMTILVLPSIFGFFLSRYITYVIAKKHGHV